MGQRWTEATLRAMGYQVDGTEARRPAVPARVVPTSQTPEGLAPVPLCTAPGLRLVLPFPPTVNHYYWRTPTRVILRPAARAYRDEVYARVQEESQRQETLTGPVRIAILAHPPDRRRRDLDNISKALHDALQHAGVYVDDSQIVDVRTRWGAVSKPGYVEVHVSAMSQEAS